MNSYTLKLKCKRASILSTLILFLSIIPGLSQNQTIGNFLTLLSTQENSVSVNDTYPEMVIVGNTIHVIWTQLSGNYHVIYRRSTDLGKTWEEPRIVYSFIYQTREPITHPRSRKLAVDGTNVHIALCEAANSASQIVYLRSVDNGNTFEPVKTLKSMGGDGWFRTCHVKAMNGKVAIVYRGTLNAKPRISLLASANNGTSFTETLIKTWGSGQDADLTDFLYDGTQAIVLWKYSWNLPGSYDWSSRPYVSVSNNGGASFTTTLLLNEKGEDKNYQKTVQDVHYAPKIAKSGNNIHLVFHGYDKDDKFTVFHAISTDNGLSFQKVTDINKGLVPVDQIQPGCEAIAAKNGNVYLAFLRKNSWLYVSHSADNGMTFDETRNIFPEGYSYVGGTWYPGFAFDPTDPSGKTVYAYGNGMISTKTADGGKTFSQHLRASPIFSSLRTAQADLLIDQEGNKHWISEYVWMEAANISDVYYKKIIPEPEPGTINKSFFVETVYNGKKDVVVVPPSPSLDFDSAFTAEAWIRFDLTVFPENSEVGVLGKINGIDKSNYDPSCFVMTYKKSGGKMCLYSSIETDKGDFINYNNQKGYIDTLWHHVAITYDAQGGLNNFKSYVDGLLISKQTVTGKLNQGNGLFLVGKMANYNQSSKIYYDDVRLWNRALSQEELLENQTKTLSGKENGLKLFLNFNDTFKDISGNGNDGLPNYWGQLTKSDFNPPIPAFDLFSQSNRIILTNKTQNGSSYSWDFGDGKSSTLENPVYTYAKPGEYTIALSAHNNNSVASLIKPVSITGLDRIEPTSAGNCGLASIKIFGGGISSKTTAKLLNSTSVIEADTLIFNTSGEINAVFQLEGQTAGKYDVVVTIAEQNFTLKEALTVETCNASNPYVQISGRSAVLTNRWQVRTIEIVNPGNTDLFNVPLYIAVSDLPGLEYEFVNVDFSLSDFSLNLGHGYLKETIPPYAIQKGLFGPADGNTQVQGDYSAKVFPLTISTLPQNSSVIILLRIKSTESYEVMAWTNKYSEDPLQKSLEINKGKDPFGECIWQASLNGLINAGGDALGLILKAFPVSCAKASWDAMNNAYKTAKNGNPKIRNTLWDLTSIAVNCGAYLTGAGPAYEAALNLTGVLMTGYSTMRDYYDCWSKYAPARLKTLVAASFDPNEMVGPSGYGPQNWIRKTPKVSYSVLFENKSTATAPAHEVFITDTLDVKKFNLNEFGFGSFGFGDTIVALAGKNLKKFAIDIDLRPQTSLITRVSGNLDTISGIIRWEFISLNPETMAYEEDPFIGFLPPNDVKHSGEGFVSFSVGLKNNLLTRDEIENQATIVFDANAPIFTNKYTNTIDIDPPVSKVDQLNATSGNRLTLNWTGSDEGSGIESYSVYYLENDSLLVPVVLDTKSTSILFIANVGSRYKFYSVATDFVSLKENQNGLFETSTHVTVGVEESKAAKEKMQVLFNRVTKKLKVLIPGAPSGTYLVDLVDIKGQSCFTGNYEGISVSNGFEIGTELYNPGIYLLRVYSENYFETTKITLR